MHTLSPYTFGITVPGSPESNRPRVEEALKAEGFGVLTKIDVQATMKEKLGVEREQYLIFGACNPPLANRALAADPSVGALLPCNVVLRAEGEATVVEAMDPLIVMGIVHDPAVHTVAVEAHDRLERAIASLETPRD